MFGAMRRTYVWDAPGSGVQSRVESLRRRSRRNRIQQVPRVMR